MVSPDGGVEIEKVAEETPDRIFKEFIHPGIGLSAYQTRKLAFALGLQGPQVAQATKLMTAVYDAFVATDASLIEVNPLIVTEEGNLLALDAKMNFDDNALYRHADVKELRDLSEEDPLEIEASKFSLNYIKLDGTIGCMVNGAGLAMATMDIIKLAGGEPANFLDVGGGANAEQIRNAFKILMSDKSVRAVLINIFGGILRCDVLAEGVIAAVKDLGVSVPIVIRMEGTNVEKGKQMLKDSGLNFTTADDMKEAAEKVVALGEGGVERRSRRSAVSWCELRIDYGCLDRQEHAAARPGAHRPRRHLSRQAGRGVRHHGRRRGDAREGRHDARGLAGLQHRDRLRARNGRQRVGDLRAAGRRRRRHSRSGGRRASARRVHHRGHSDARHDAGALPRSADRRHASSGPTVPA